MSDHYHLWESERDGQTPQTVSFLIDDYLLFCHAQNRQPSTIRDKKQRLEQYLKWLQSQYESEPDLSRWTARNFRQWLATLKARNLSGFTIRGYASVTKTFSRWLVREGHLEQDPLRYDKLPPVPKTRVQPFTDEETDQLLAAIDWHFPECAWRQMAIFVFLLDTGVRISELVGLTDERLDLEGQRAYIIGKGQKERWIYFGSQCRRILHRYTQLWRPVALGVPSHVFRAPDGGPMSRDRVEQICRTLGVRAGINRVHPHRFRHTFGYRFIRAGGNVFSLQRLLGHSQVSTVMIYVEMQEEDLQRDHRRFSPGDRLKLPRR